MLRQHACLKVNHRLSICLGNILARVLPPSRHECPITIIATILLLGQARQKWASYVFRYTSSSDIAIGVDYRHHHHQTPLSLPHHASLPEGPLSQGALPWLREAGISAMAYNASGMLLPLWPRLGGAARRLLRSCRRLLYTSQDRRHRIDRLINHQRCSLIYHTSFFVGNIIGHDTRFTLPYHQTSPDYRPRYLPAANTPPILITSAVDTATFHITLVID